jgi:hypothetical protein
MARRRHRRTARREDLGLTAAEFTLLGRLDTPHKIQLFVNAIPANYEAGGETIFSVREVLRQGRAHCIEAAFVAACALWIHGERPLLMYMDCDPCDFPHVVALFRRGACWGAISKSNGSHLRYRDPIYRSLRELAMSYFHEYFDRSGHKTLRSYSRAFDMRRVDPGLWVTRDSACEEAHARLASLRQFALISPMQQRALSRRDGFEREVARKVEHVKGGLSER